MIYVTHLLLVLEHNVRGVCTVRSFVLIRMHTKVPHRLAMSPPK